MRYIISGGGTGGHIYPALAIIDEIKKQDKNNEILYVGKKDSLEEELTQKNNIKFEPIHISALPRKKINKDMVITMVNLLKGLSECSKILNKFKPDVVIGTGGYVCAPIVFKAQQKKIKTAIQEQNAYPGKTNRILARKADMIFLNFQEAKKYFTNENIFFTGNPIRSDFGKLDRKTAREKLNIDENEKVVFSFGGSGGQESTNEAIKEIINSKEKLDFKLIHITGRKYYDKFIDGLDIPENVEIYDYTFDVPDFLFSADLVIASSSAMTLAEISAVGVSSILIPKAYTAGNHQVFNANSYKEKEAAVVLLEDQLNGDILLKNIKDILNDKSLSSKMALNAKKLGNINAVKNIVKEIIK